MILELRIKNFLSFKEEVIFSFEATKDKTFEDYQIVEVAPGVRILRLAVVYGANASGKTNLINAFEFLGSFWFHIPVHKSRVTGIVPFLMDKTTPEQPSDFVLTFYINGMKYQYHLKADRQKVLSEKLYVYPGTQPALVFDRRLTDENLSDITFNPKRVKISQAAKDEITLKCLPNMSVLAAYNQVNISIPEIEEMSEWGKSQFMYTVEPAGKSSRLIGYTEKLIRNDQSAKVFVLDFLRRADYNINDILARTDKNTEFEHSVVNNEGEIEFYKMSLLVQSDGTLRTFGLTGLIFEAIQGNAFLAIDEIESSLHPRQVEFILEDFLKNHGHSQLLVTTHYDGLLEETDLLRKDSIWFTNKKETGSTELYSLSDFKGINRISSLQKAYKYGKFGAIPNI